MTEIPLTPDRSSVACTVKRIVAVPAEVSIDVGLNDRPVTCGAAESPPVADAGTHAIPRQRTPHKPATSSRGQKRVRCCIFRPPTLLKRMLWIVVAPVNLALCDEAGWVAPSNSHGSWEYAPVTPTCRKNRSPRWPANSTGDFALTTPGGEPRSDLVLDARVGVQARGGRPPATSSASAPTPPASTARRWARFRLGGRRPAIHPGLKAVAPGPPPRPNMTHTSDRRAP